MKKLMVLLVIVFVLFLGISAVSAADTTAPTAVAGSPARDAVNVKVYADVNTTFSEDIHPGSNYNQIALQPASGGASAVIETSINGKTLTIKQYTGTYMQAGTKYRVVLPAGSLTDEAGNPIAAYSRCFTTDGTPPTAVAGSPARNAVNVPVTTQIKTTFNEDILPGSTSNYSSIALRYQIGTTRSGSPIFATRDVSVSIDGKVLTVTPNSNLAKATKYSLILPAGSLTDLSGNAIVFYSRSFTTDSTAPTAVAGSPARNAVNVPVTTQIKTTFNENIYQGSNFYDIKLTYVEIVDGVSVTRSIDNGDLEVSIDGAVLTVQPYTHLAGSTKYTLVLPTGSLKDLAGNGIAAYSRPFTTDSTAPKAIAGSPARNAVNVAVGKTITTTFNEKIIFGNNYASIKLKHKEGSSWVYDDAHVSILDNVLIVDPNSDLAKGTTYTLDLPAGSLCDEGWNPIAAYSRPFTTTYT